MCLGSASGVISVTDSAAYIKAQNTTQHKKKTVCVKGVFLAGRLLCRKQTAAAAHESLRGSKRPDVTVIGEIKSCDSIPITFREMSLW